MERIDHEPLLDSEYFADISSFADPMQWQEVLRLSTSPVYRINAASLDCCEMSIDSEVRLRRRLTDNLAFRFHLTQVEDKERQETHHWIELEQNLGRGFSVILLGEPAFRKENADIGLGAAWTVRPRKKLRLRFEARRIFVDFNFNQRGGGAQRYSRKPLTDELSLSLYSAVHSLDARLELDHPLKRDVQDENRSFSYRRTTAALRWRLVIGENSHAVGEYSYEFQKKSDFFAPDPATAGIENERKTHRILAAAVLGAEKEGSLEAGHRLLLRSARTDRFNGAQAGVFYRRWESQPYARWRRSLNTRLTGELASFLSLGENRRRFPSGTSPSLLDSIVEAKLGTGLDFNFGPAGRIGLYGTFDLDSPGHPWDGGNVRAMFFF